MLAAAPAAAVRAPTRPPRSSPRLREAGWFGRAAEASGPAPSRARPRPGACVRFARTPALASRDRIAGSAVRALDPRRRSARSSSSSPAAAPIFVSAAVEVDERDADDASDLDVFDEPTVSIPISFFSILNVTPARASPAAIEAAYAGVINRELVDGFSDGCLAARADLVDAAAQVLSDPDLRREHEDDVKNGRLTPVPASQLGGALALMQEAGEHESVIEYAPECLAAVSTVAGMKGANRRDITLSAALAHCEHNVARRPHRDAPEGGRGVRAARHRVLHPRRRGGPEIQRGAPGDDQPNASGDGAGVRHRAPLHAPRGGEGAKGGPEGAAPDLVGRVQRRRRVLNDRDAYVRRCCLWHLTSEEIVDLFLDAPSDSPADVDEIYNAAMAHVVCGYTQHRPSLLMDADEMFAQLEDGVGRGERCSRPIRHHGGRRRSSGRVSQFRAAAAGGAGDGGARRVPDSDGPHRGRRVHPRLDPGTAGVRDGGPAG